MRPVSSVTRSSVSSASVRSVSKCVIGVVRIVGVGGDLRPHAAVAAERRVDRAAPRRRAALDEREVLAGDVAPRAAPPAGRRASARRGRAGAGRTCRGPAGARRRAAQGRARPRRGPPAPARASRRGCPRAGWTTTPGGLVDHDQVLVLVGDLELRRRRRRLALGAPRGVVELDRLAARPAAWRFGRAVPSTRTQPGVDQLAAPSRASPAPRPGRRPAARRRPPRDATRSLGTSPGRRSASSTPNVTAMSATLNAGQCGNLMKSVTAPSRIRSIRLPAAPPSSSPVGSQTSRRVQVRDEEDEQRGERDAGDDHDERPAAREHAERHARVARVDQLDPEDRARPPRSGEISARTIALVS